MKNHTFVGYMDYTLRNAVFKGGREDEIVKRYCEAIERITKPMFNGVVVNKRRIYIRSGYIHRKPFVKFVSPGSIHGMSSTELGDILFVKKVRRKGLTQAIYITFCQVKKYNSGWKFEPHQFEFALKHQKYKIAFGKTYQSNALESTIFKIPRAKHNLFNYLLLSNVMNLACDLKKLKPNYSGGEFKVDCCLMASRGNLIEYCPNYDYKVFLNRFLFSKREYGESVLGNKWLKHVMNIVYKAHSWQMDPPEEFEESYNAELGGFGIIEVTLDKEEDEE